MPTYRRCESDVARLVSRRVEASYPDLLEAGATFYLEFAHAAVDDAGEVQGSAMKDRGTPILGKVKVIAEADRVAGLPDVRLTLDGDEWPNLTDGRQAALIDTLLCALHVRRDGRAVKLDKCGRPAIKVRPAEIYVRGFYQVLERHGEEAVEAEALQVAWDHCLRQGLLEFPEPAAPVDAGPREGIRRYALRRGIDLHELA